MLFLAIAWSLPTSGASGKLGAVHNHVYKLAEQGQIPGTLRLGRALRFSRSAVRSWLSQGAASEGDDR
ncbi:MAG TPA: helix-turn-helix domain-containing protein [Nannocystaceae bacterium]|nr:helix-turn-helix domain-containing protein [Nannocystaceae bacterium]